MKLSATFYNPVLDEQIRQDNNGKEKVEFGYIFPKGSVLLCGRFQLTYFCPAIIQINCMKMTLKIVASRCSINAGDGTINKFYSS